MRIKTEIQLPKAKGNIANIICSYLDVRNLDKDLGQEKLTVRGEVCYCVIYQSEEGEMEWVDGMTSVTGDMKNDNPDFDLYWAKLNMTQQDIEAEMDYDREMSKRPFPKSRRYMSVGRRLMWMKTADWRHMPL